MEPNARISEVEMNTKWEEYGSAPDSGKCHDNELFTMYLHAHRLGMKHALHVEGNIKQQGTCSTLLNS